MGNHKKTLSLHSIKKLLFAIMENKRHQISIDESLYNKIKEYCGLNSLKVSEFCNQMLNNKFMEEMYGDTPFSSKKGKEEETPTQKEEKTTPIILSADTENKIEETNNQEERVKASNNVETIKKNYTKRRLS